MAVELRPHQKEAVKKMHNGCILYGGVGVGKSITALAYFFEEVCGGEVGTWGFTQGARDIYIITTAKKRDNLDWEHEALHFGITAHTDDDVNGINLKVDSWNNIDKYKDVRDAFFIFDEQRLVGSGAWTKAFIKIAKSNEWVLLSATPGDTWLDYIPVFVANGFYKNRTEFKLRHVVYNTYSKFPKVDRYLETGHLLHLRNSILVHMPYEKHTTRHEQMLWVDYDQDLMKKVEEKRWHVYENRPLRDVAEQFLVMRKVVNSDSSRLQAVRSLLHKHPRLIVFYNFDYELEILRTLAHATPEEMDPASSVPTSDALSSSLEVFTWSEEEQLRELAEARARLSGTSTPTSLSTPETSTGSTASMDTSATAIEEPSSATAAKPSTADFTVAEWNESVTSEDSTLPAQPLKVAETRDASFAIAEWNGHKHQPIPETDRWVYLVQYAAGAEGWNCTSTDAMCFYSLPYSYKLFHQAHGRIDRLNTKFRDLRYYVLLSKSRIDVSVRKSLKVKKSFNESSFGVKW